MIDTYGSWHNHSDFTNALCGFPDSICKLNDLIQQAYDYGLSSIAITEHEGLSSHIKAINYYNKMQKDRSFTLALGNEIYLMEEQEDLINREQNNTYPYYHFILIALDTEGHHQLRLLSTRAWLRAWRQGKIYRKPTYYTDLEEIIRPNQGHVIGLSACLGSRLDKLILQQRDVKGEINRLTNIFGKGNFYLEVQPARDKTCDQWIVNNEMKSLGAEFSLKIIPTTDSHYLKKSQSQAHKTYLLSQDGDREVDDFYATAYMMTPTELREHLRFNFDDESIDKMFQDSIEIKDRVKEYNIFHDPIVPQVPKDKIPESYQISHRYKEYYGKYPSFAHYSQVEDNPWEKYFFYQIEQALYSKVERKGLDIEKYIARLDEEWKELIIISEQLNTSMASYYQTMSYIIDLVWEAGSLSMPARGSAAGFLTCFLLEVTQIDPVPLGSYFPSWRHLNHERGIELPDIDNDSEASKKVAIVNKMKEFFGEDKVINVATFSKISSKQAIEKSCRGLNISDDVAGFLKSLVPVNRGKVASLKEALTGSLKTEIIKYPNLLESCLAIEGLISNRGKHPAGVLLTNEPYTDYISAMRSPDGDIESCYELWDDELAGCLKVDMLTTICADRIHKTMDMLIEHGKMKRYPTLKETYYKNIHPDVINYDNPKMWDKIPSIYSIFQFDTPISQKALSATHPKCVMDLSASNSLLRLMPDGDEPPIERYKRYKESHEAWIKDTTDYGLNDEERSILWKYLADAYGLADSQEKIMRLSMDKQVAGYSLKEANKLRKSIAKKDEKLQAEAKNLFFEYGRKIGTREVFLDYIWNVVFAASMGYEEWSLLVNLIKGVA